MVPKYKACNNVKLQKNEISFAGTYLVISCLEEETSKEKIHLHIGTT